jgi:nitrite reductase (NADH) large subunit
MGRFLQFYRENARYLERTYDFVERVGIDTIRDLLIADSKAIGDRLDRDMQASVDSYRDPWTEANVPTHPNQFVTSL